ASSVTPPSSRRRRERRIATTRTAEPLRTSPISVHVARAISKPPSAPNAAPARTSATSALTAKEAKRDTSGLGPAVAHQQCPRERAHHSQRNEREQKGGRELVRPQAVRRVEEPGRAGYDEVAAHRDSRRLGVGLVVRRGVEGVQVGGRAGLGSAGGDERGIARHRGARRTAAAPALRGARDERAVEDVRAVAVLVDVAREVLERLLELVTRIVTLELAVVVAVGDRVA